MSLCERMVDQGQAGMVKYQTLRYKRQEDGESHSHPHREGTRHINDNLAHSVCCSQVVTHLNFSQLL